MEIFLYIIFGGAYTGVYNCLYSSNDTFLCIILDAYYRFIKKAIKELFCKLSLYYSSGSIHKPYTNSLNFLYD